MAFICRTTTVIPLITHICALSINRSIFPDIWKLAIITPLHKSGPTNEPSNFRSISVLPCLGKILERVTHIQLYSYLSDHNMLAEEQSGFRTGYSTGTCLTTFLDPIYLNMDQGCPSGVLFLDLRKAFDVVDHKILLSKFRNMESETNHCYG